jgi:hypothetical protein
MSKLKPLSPQDKFDTIMLLLTETVSSQHYLNHYKIYRAETKGPSAWDKFTKQIIKKSPDLKQGIYPRSYDGSVHYFALRKESDDTFTLANGYSDAGGAGLIYGRPLRAQPDHSHGLCQTFALMYYENQADQIIPGDYQENVRIGLNWLEQYLALYDWEFSYNDNEINVVQLNEQGLNARPKEKTSLKALLGRWPANRIYKDVDDVDVIRLHDLVVWLLAPQRRHLLNAWAADLQ